MTMIRSGLVATAALVLALAACSQSPATTTTSAYSVSSPPPFSPSSPSSPEVQAQLEAQLDGLRVLDPKLGSDLKLGEQLVRVSVTLSNPGAAAIPLDFAPIDVFTGPNRYSTNQDPGWMGTSDQVSSAPTQVAAHGTAMVYTSFDVPTAGMGDITVVVVGADGGSILAVEHAERFLARSS